MTGDGSALGPLAGLVGTWTGAGRGFYPTIADFAYRERTVFERHGPLKLAYRQTTESAADGSPLHAESGFWRVGDSAIEVVFAHATGHVETASVVVEAGAIRVRSLSVLAAPAAKEVLAVERTYRLDGDTMRYELSMDAVGQGLRAHLTALLTRT